MNLINVRFYGELNDFLPAGWRMRTVTLKVDPGQLVQDIIRFTGIPLNLIDLILVNGSPVEFTHALQSNDRLTVYPEFYTIDISPMNLINRNSIH